MRGAALACLLACASPLGGCTRACKDGTLFLTVAYQGAAATADRVDLTITIPGRSETEHVTPSGGPSDTVEIDFPQGYPAGSSFTIQVVADKGGAPVGAGALDATFSDGCSAFTVVVTPPTVDQGAPPDLSRADLAGADLAPPPDFAVPTDLAGADLAGADFATAPDLAKQRTLGFTSALGFQGINGPRGIVLAELDGDGKLDVAVTEYHAGQGSQVWAATGKGDGSFPNVMSFPCGLGPVGIVALDMDGDGRIDLATVNDGSSDVTTMHNKSGGGLFFDAPRQSSQAGLAIATGDWNGDGRADVIAAYPANASVHSWLGGGNLLQSVGLFPAGDVCAALGASDLNGDGKPDAVCAGLTNGKVMVLPGGQNGQFAMATGFQGAPSPAALALADFDGDGHRDVAVLSSTMPIVDVLHNDGNGGLVLLGTTTLPAAGGTALVTADFDADGKADLALAAGGAIYVLQGLGNGAFQLPYAIPGVTAAAGLAAGDVNADGLIDLASADEGKDRVTIYINVTQ